MRSLMMVSAMTLGLAACGQGGAEDSPAETGSASAPMPNEAASDFSADVTVMADEATLDAMVVYPDLSATYVEGVGIVISGTTYERNSAGSTSGAAFVLGDEMERQISGHEIVVKVLAKGEADASMAVAYSTNEVGNSGWKSFDLTTEFAEYTFPYSVTSLVNGRNDYIAIIPVQGEVTVAAVGADIGEPLSPDPAPAAAESGDTVSGTAGTPAPAGEETAPAEEAPQ